MPSHPPPNRLARAIRAVAEFLIVGACALGFGVTLQLIAITLAQSDTVATRDFSVYWATGRQLAQHANPYDAAKLWQIERSLGFPEAMGVKFMRNPPWVLPLVYPLGFFGIRTASLLWSAVAVLCLVASVRLLWIRNGRPRNHRDWLALSFAPALLCLILGQTSIFALLGLVLFLFLHRTRPFLAGCSLWLCLLKPHLLLPFGVVLLLWVWTSKSYRILAGVAAATGVSVAVAAWIDPAAWTQYSAMLRNSGIDMEPIPCLSFLLRRELYPHAFWMQYIPAVLGCAWAITFYWPRRFRWDWIEDGSLLILVSILVAPYCWLFDQTLAIPALLRGAYAARSRDLLLALAFASVCIEGALLFHGGRASAVYLWTLWTAPAWLVWFWIATSGFPGSPGGKKALAPVGQ